MWVSLCIVVNCTDTGSPCTAKCRIVKVKIFLGIVSKCVVWIYRYDNVMWNKLFCGVTKIDNYSENFRINECYPLLYSDILGMCETHFIILQLLNLYLQFHEVWHWILLIRPNSTIWIWIISCSEYSHFIRQPSWRFLFALLNSNCSKNSYNKQFI